MNTNIKKIIIVFSAIILGPVILSKGCSVASKLTSSAPTQENTYVTACMDGALTTVAQLAPEMFQLVPPAKLQNTAHRICAEQVLPARKQVCQKHYNSLLEQEKALCDSLKK